MDISTAPVFPCQIFHGFLWDGLLLLSTTRAGQQQSVSSYLLRPVFILYGFGNKMFWPCFKIHNCPNCTWFDAKSSGFGRKSVFTHLGMKTTQVAVLALRYCLELFKSYIYQIRDVLNPWEWETFFFPLSQLWWNQQVSALCSVNSVFSLPSGWGLPDYSG